MSVDHVLEVGCPLPFPAIVFHPADVFTPQSLGLPSFSLGHRDAWIAGIASPIGLIGSETEPPVSS